MDGVFINVGAGNRKLAGFVNLDMDSGADVQADVRRGLPFPSNSVDGIYCEHFIEHLTQAEGVRFLRECRRVLVPDGRLRVATPDLDHAIQRYLSDWQNQAWLHDFHYEWIDNRCEYLNIGMREWGHQWSYNEEELTRLATCAGLSRPARCTHGESEHPAFRGLEWRKDSHLIMEFTKPCRATGLGEALVSVLIPAYNPKYFRLALESALKQTFRQLEIVVSDDSATDEIRRIVDDYAGTDRRIRYYRNRARLGAGANYIHCFELASGDYIKFLNDDDLLHPGCVSRMAECLDSYPEVTLVTSHRQCINASGRALPDIGATRRIVTQDSVVEGVSLGSAMLYTRTNFVGEPTTVMFRRADLCDSKPDILSFAGRRAAWNVDVSMWLSLLSKGDAIYLTETLSYFRLHAEQDSRATSAPEKGDAAWQQARFDAHRMGFQHMLSEPRLVVLPMGPHSSAGASNTNVSTSRNVHRAPASHGSGLAPTEHPLGTNDDREAGRRRAVPPGTAIPKLRDTAVESERLLAPLDQLMAAGREALERGDLEVAAREFARLTEQHPELAAAHTALGSTLMALERPQEAVPHLRRAAELAPNAAALHNQLGVALFQSGDAKGAETAFTRAREADPADIGAVLNLVHLHRTEDRYVEATELIKDALRIDPNNADILASFATLSLELGDLEGAELGLRRLLAVAPDHPEAVPIREAIDGVRPSATAADEANAPAAGVHLADAAPQSTEISIIIPVYNRLDLTKQCLDAVHRNTGPSSYEVIVVDNGSTDGTQEFLLQQQASGQLRAILNERNLGFARACNQGAEAAVGRYLLFLNNDTEVQPNWLPRLKEVLDADPAVGVAGSKMLLANGTIDNAGILLVEDQGHGSSLFLQSAFSRLPGNTPEANQPRTYQAVTGACLMVRKSAFDEAGGFDEGYWNGFEDIDLFFTLQERGWKIVYQPESAVLHHVSQSGPERFRRAGQNTERLKQKWLGRIRPDLIITPDGNIADGGAGRVACYQMPNTALTSGTLETCRPGGRRPRNGKQTAEEAKCSHAAAVGGMSDGYVQEARGSRELRCSRHAPLLAPTSEDLGRFRDLRVALIYDNIIRPDTTGEYCRRALEQICQVKHVLPHHLNTLRAEDYDLFLQIDDGLKYLLPSHLRPAAWWVIDTHLQYEWDREKAAHFDAVFAAQRNGTERLRDDGIPAVWLPLAADPEVHRLMPVPERLDWCFVGNLTEPENPVGPERAALIELLRQRFPNHYVGRAFGDDMARRYSEARVVFNRSVRDDVNMRVFEALAMGRPLLTNALDDNGLPELFEEGKEMAVYRTPEELQHKLQLLLSDDQARRSMGTAAHAAVLSRHTYSHRMGGAIEWLHEVGVMKALSSSRTAAVEPDTSSKKTVPPALVSIVILTHNELSATQQCLASVEAHTPEPHELIVVDNASTDRTVDYLRAYAATREHVRVIANSANRGFAAGNNQALSIARGDYVLLLNNDTIVTPGWLSRMLAAFQTHPQTGVVGPMAHYVSGPQLVPDPGYHSIEELEAFASKWSIDHDGESTRVMRLVGFCLLARRAVVDRIGGLDERYGSGNFEDDDFCVRAAFAGYEARIAQDVFIHHSGGQTFKAAKIDYNASLLRNWELFKTKWGVPSDSPYEKGYRITTAPPSAMVPVQLPDLADDHALEESGRWWQEMEPANEHGGGGIVTGTLAADGARSPQDLLDKLMAAGREAMDRGDLEAAARESGQLVERYPDLAAAHTALGSTLTALGRVEEAIPHLRRAADLVPQAAAMHNQLGVALYQVDDLQGAEAAFQRARDVDRQDVQGLLNLIDLYRGQERYVEATEAIKEALTRNAASAGVLSAFTTLSLELGDADGAEMGLQRLRDIQPDHPDVDPLQQAVEDLRSCAVAG
ncbi:MAG: glycosyltransferase [Dehalococcoidales bacterium]|nr:glycosyltransferase [Dehalococcoidales bacterium]